MTKNQPNQLEAKVDYLICLLQEWHNASTRHSLAASNASMARDLIVSTFLGSIVGYFMFKILDHHLGNYPQARKK